jgi:hypothetical protein
MIRFCDFTLAGAPPLLSLVVRRAEGFWGGEGADGQADHGGR